LSLVLLSFGTLVVTSMTLHKGYHFSLCYPSLHAHCCSPWGQSLRSTVLFHLLPYFSWWCRFFLSAFFLPRTLLLLVFLFPISKALHYVPHYFLPPHFPYSALHHPTPQHFEFVFCYLLFPLFLPTSTVPGQVPELSQTSFSHNSTDTCMIPMV